MPSHAALPPTYPPTPAHNTTTPSQPHLLGSIQPVLGPADGLGGAHERTRCHALRVHVNGGQRCGAHHRTTLQRGLRRDRVAGGVGVPGGPSEGTASVGWALLAGPVRRPRQVQFANAGIRRPGDRTQRAQRTVMASCSFFRSASYLAPTLASTAASFSMWLHRECASPAVAGESAWVSMQRSGAHACVLLPCPVVQVAGGSAAVQRSRRKMQAAAGKRHPNPTKSVSLRSGAHPWPKTG